jgi:hypothetical protein
MQPLGTIYLYHKEEYNAKYAAHEAHPIKSSQLYETVKLNAYSSK